MTALRARAAFLEQDRPLAPDIEAAHDLVKSGWFLHHLWPEEQRRPILAKPY